MALWHVGRCLRTVGSQKRGRNNDQSFRNNDRPEVVRHFDRKDAGEDSATDTSRMAFAESCAPENISHDLHGSRNQQRDEIPTAAANGLEEVQAEGQTEECSKETRCGDASVVVIVAVVL